MLLVIKSADCGWSLGRMWNEMARSYGKIYDENKQAVSQRGGKTLQRRGTGEKHKEKTKIEQE